MIYTITSDSNQYDWAKKEASWMIVGVSSFDKIYIDKGAVVKTTKRFEIKDVETGDVVFEDREVSEIDTNEIVKKAKEQVILDCKSKYDTTPKSVIVELTKVNAKSNKAYYDFSYTMEYRVYGLTEGEVIQMFVDGYTNDSQHKLTLNGETPVMYIVHISDFQ